MRIQAWMKHPVITVKPHLTLAPAAFVADAARLMRRERIGAIPIVEGGRLVGILTRSGVLDAFVEPSYSTLPSG
jgi:CBS domain-containing protein